MTNTGHDPVERALARESEWTGGETELWRKALEQTDAPPSSMVFKLRAWGAIGAAAALLLVATVFMLPSRRAATPQQAASAPRHATDELGANMQADSVREMETQAPPAALSAPAGDALAMRDDADGRRLRSEEAQLSKARAPRPGSAAGASQSSPRLTIHRASIELRTPDVRAAFLRAQQAVIPAQGEHVESSWIAGEGETAQASLTLRVVSGRLDAAMIELRALGTVEGERLNTQDATAQAADLDARLTNERRVEQELLNLVATRADAPLEDVLKLRASLSAIRLTIEQLQAQRDTLGKLSSLSTVLVEIRASEQPRPQGMLERFEDEAADGWASSVRFLSGALGVAVRVGVGGAVFWAPIALAIFFVHRRSASRAGR